MNKHEQLCRSCADQAGLVLSGSAMTIRQWRACWETITRSELIKYVDNGCIVCHNNDEGLITDCVINVSVIK